MLTAARSSRRTAVLRFPKHVLGRSRSSHPVCAAAQTEDPVYKGIYGDWQVEESDRLEVLGYRGGISVAALALLLETAIAFSPEGSGLRSVLGGLQNGIVLTGAVGLGVSLVLIHIYVTPLKRFLQAIYLAGLAGGIGLIATQADPLPQYVAQHPSAVWLVGPFFAAVTGLAFKEGMCYGKPECAALFFVTPILLLGHLTGLIPESGQQGLLLAFVALFTVFAGRKYTQAIKDDIGDKSVFMFQAMSEDQQQAHVAAMQQPQGLETSDSI
ncbi:hypothetical protein WJX72_003956 [[Myrmecia] bisecta]|uniref:Integral membrane protein n=1 Tax=[Myrmecia] bisecta TaxID=41462 RepID=A0AAW1R5P6_9CHLO